VASPPLGYRLIAAAAMVVAACHSGSSLSFGQTSFRVEPGGHHGTVLVASTERQRQHGLMGRRELGSDDGMLFVFPGDTATSFYMRGTPLPLTVAWFAADGSFLGSADMKPCADRPGCKLYPPPSVYRTALEVEQGRLAGLGIGPGSRLTYDAVPGG